MFFLSFPPFCFSVVVPNYGVGYLLPHGVVAQYPQILPGLLVGSNGYPIGYELFEGNKYEGHTLIPVLEQFQQRFNLSRPIVIADAGLLSAPNIKDFTSQQYEFILEGTDIGLGIS
ncbi:MAG: transposase [Bacteroidales bacterium]|nr:transposase [Bacteroidales bacterium]